jgi:hypothetical protein
LEIKVIELRATSFPSHWIDTGSKNGASFVSGSVNQLIASRPGGGTGKLLRLPEWEVAV